MPPSGALDSGLAEPWRERVITRALGPAIGQALDRAQAFMTAAVDLIGSSSDTVGVQDIADRAGMSLRLLYRHFESKDDLVAAVLEDAFARSALDIEERLARVRDPERRLRTLLHALVEVQPTPLNRGFARHEAALMLHSPGAVARAQSPLSALVRTVVDEAGAPAGSAYLVMAAKRAYNWSRLFGNEFGLADPDPSEFVAFHLHAVLGAGPDDAAAGATGAGRRRPTRPTTVAPTRGQEAAVPEWSNGFVAAAVDLMGERGDAFTVQDLCDASGLSMRHFYQHFASKDAVLVAALGESIARITAVSQVELEAIADPTGRLSAYLLGSMSHTPDRLATTLVGLALELSRTHPVEMARAQAPQVTLAASLIEAAGGDAETGTALVMSLRSAYNHSRLLGNELGLDMPAPDAVVAHLRRGLEATAPRVVPV